VNIQGRWLTLRRACEALMYLAFLAAALPFTWLGVSNLFYFHAHREALETRDSAVEVLSVVLAARITLIALAVAVPIALFFLATGPRAARISSTLLASAWLLYFFLVLALDAPPFTSMARLYWDGIPFAVLAMLPMFCAGFSVAVRNRRPAVDSRRR
jgi:hypothetical protein